MRSGIRAALYCALFIAAAASGCSDSTSDDEAAGGSIGSPACNNTCTTYPSSWMSACPSGSRCIEFRNSCAGAIQLSYQVGCDADGNPGAPQCNCTLGPEIPSGSSRYWEIVDGNDTSECVPNVEPPCVTSGLAIMANDSTMGASPMCSAGTRLEFTAGNQGNEFQRFDSYDIDVEKASFTVPVVFRTDLACTTAGNDFDCRAVYCDAERCPDAFVTPTMGGCPDGRSPAVGCQDTFNQSAGLVAEYCPAMCSTPNSGTCPMCVDNTKCSN